MFLLNLSSAPFPHASSTTWWLRWKIYFLLASHFARNKGATSIAPCRCSSCLAKINWFFFQGIPSNRTDKCKTPSFKFQGKRIIHVHLYFLFSDISTKLFPTAPSARGLEFTLILFHRSEGSLVHHFRQQYWTKSYFKNTKSVGLLHTPPRQNLVQFFPFL